MPNDLRVTLAYLGKTELRRIAAIDGDTPGWFVSASRNEGYDTIINYTRVTSDDALRIAREVDSSCPPGRNSVESAVQSVVVDLNRTRAARREAAEKRLAAAQAELSALDEEAAGISLDSTPSN